jgi:hypothetical protein
VSVCLWHKLICVLIIPIQRSKDPIMCHHNMDFPPFDYVQITLSIPPPKNILL